MVTVDFLDAIRLRHGLRSDYMVAKLMGVSTQRVSNWRSGRETMGESACMKAAELLELDPGFVLVSSAAERAKLPGARAALAAAALLLASAGGTAHASEAPGFEADPGRSLYIMSNRRAWRRDRRRSWRPFRFCPALPLLAA